MNWKRLALAMAWLTQSAGVMRVACFRTYKPVRNGQANQRIHQAAAAHDEPPLVMRGVRRLIPAGRTNCRNTNSQDFKGSTWRSSWPTPN